MKRIYKIPKILYKIFKIVPGLIIGNDVINTDEMPVMPEPFDILKIISHVGNGIRVVNSNTMALYQPDNHDSKTWYMVKDELNGGIVPNACMLLYYLNYPYLIAKEWERDAQARNRGFIGFLGTSGEDAQGDQLIFGMAFNLTNNGWEWEIAFRRQASTLLSGDYIVVFKKKL